MLYVTLEAYTSFDSVMLAYCLKSHTGAEWCCHCLVLCKNAQAAWRKDFVGSIAPSLCKRAIWPGHSRREICAKAGSLFSSLLVVSVLFPISTLTRAAFPMLTTSTILVESLVWYWWCLNQWLYGFNHYLTLTLILKSTTVARRSTGFYIGNTREVILPNVIPCSDYTIFLSVLTVTVSD